ncbi:MAG: polysaccharide deacetylase family protein [Proteobacteria bacterium]|nr:polysaccharide deacetylase family protein [Pseudomonadota bacterium]
MRRKFLATARALGLFALAHRLTSRGLRILCYHGVALADEQQFQPKLFISEAVFRQRMAFLRARGYPVLTLADALQRLDAGTLPRHATVITFDDGWLGTGTLAAPVLAEARFPSTLYVTTREVLEGTPVLNVAVRYLLWAGRGAGRIESAPGGIGGSFDLAEPAQREALATAICEHGGRLEPAARLTLMQGLAARLTIDWERFERLRLCRLMDLTMLARLPAAGMDLQLHTHTHRFPDQDRVAAADEIARNRQALAPVAASELTHFCYPSGEYHAGQFAWLRESAVRSATTCVAGFNYAETERMELRRFLDGENISQLEFEAEMSGFLELLRRARRWLKPA